jgi:hypothetical protein
VRLLTPAAKSRVRLYAALAVSGLAADLALGRP